MDGTLFEGFSAGELRTIVFLIVCVVAGMAVGKKLFKYVNLLLGILLFLEICYSVSLTPINDYLPISALLQQSPMEYIGSFFEGTFLQGILNYIAGFLHNLALGTGARLHDAVDVIQEGVG